MEYIAESINRYKVFYDPVNSHATTHIEDTPQLLELLREAIGSMEFDGAEVKTHVDMRRQIGTCDVVEINDTNEIVYGVRKNREDDGLVPFVKNREGDPCTNLAMHLIPSDDNSYILSSAWIGVFDEVNDEPFPQSIYATENSVRFWSKYAFVYGSQEILPGTETMDYPWM